jgi:hypothetical protein
MMMMMMILKNAIWRMCAGGDFYSRDEMLSEMRTHCITAVTRHNIPTAGPSNYVLFLSFTPHPIVTAGLLMHETGVSQIPGAGLPWRQLCTPACSIDGS